MTIAKGDILVKVNREKYEADGTIEPVNLHEMHSIFRVREYASSYFLGEVDDVYRFGINPLLTIIY